MKEDLVTLSAQLITVKSKADRTWSLMFNTQEMGEDAAKLLNWVMMQGWLVFSPNREVDQDDVPEVQADASTGKSPSQRLRAVLRVYWEQQGRPGSWETWYLTQMERLTDTIKAKLD